MHQFSIPIEDIMDLPPIADEIKLIGLCENAVQNKFQQTEQQSLDIFIKFIAEEILITINVSKETIVEKLKEIVIQKLQYSFIYANAFDLYYNGEYMMEDTRLKHYQLQNNALIEAIFNRAQQLSNDEIQLILNDFGFSAYYGIQNNDIIQYEKNIRITLKFVQLSKCFAVGVQPRTKIRELVYACQQILNCEQVGLYHQGLYRLAPEQDFAKYEIHNGDTIEI